MKHYFLVLVSILLMLSGMTFLHASAAEAQIFDPGAKLSAEQVAESTGILQKTADSTGMNIVVILGNEQRSEITIESMTDSTYRQIYEKNTDGVCLYLDLSNAPSRYNYLYTTGLAEFYYTNAKTNPRINQILSEMKSSLYTNDISGALSVFAEQLEKYYSLGIPEHYYVYDDVFHEYRHVENGEIISTLNKPYHDPQKILLGGLFGLIIGIGAACITNISVHSRYKFIYSLSPTTYLNKKSVHYLQQTDTFIRERTTKTTIEEPSKSHSSGGGNSGGGHSHGGHGGGGQHW